MRKIIVALIAALSMLVLHAAPAHAAADWYQTAVDSTNQQQVDMRVHLQQADDRGTFYFDANTNYFWLLDQKEDSQSFGVKMNIQDQPNYMTICRNGKGAFSGWKYCNANAPVPTNDYVRFKIGTCNGSAVNCAEASNWTWIANWTNYIWVS